MSLPMWERGLKLLPARHPGASPCVAPHVGAWIETLKNHLSNQNYKSLPMWERGLKQLFEIILLAFRVSLPMWERGLKHLVNRREEVKLSRSPCGSVD